MNNSLIPAPDPGYPSANSFEDSGPPRSPFPIRKFLTALRKYWWLPLLTTVLVLGVAIAFLLWKPPTYVSKASMWETVKLRLPEGSLFSEDLQSFVGTQTELLQSTKLRDLTLAHLRTAVTNIVIPKGRDGEPLLVNVRVAGSSKSSVFVLEATSSQSAYTQAYLDALMQVYLDYKRNTRKEVSGGTLDAISKQVDRTERDLKAEQDVLLAFQRTNNFAILQQEGAIAGGYLATLKTKLSDLQLEDRLLNATTLDKDGSTSNRTNQNLTQPDTISAADSASTAGAPTERQSAFKELELLKIQREKLSRFLRPKHPKIVKLDGEIERGEKLMEIYRRQSHDQLAASRQALSFKIENVQTSIKEWEAKVVEANSRIAEAERLKLNVQRNQGVYDRLTLLVQNVGISRNIDQETLAILDSASPAHRAWTKEIGLLAMAPIGGLILGVGLLFIVALRDDRFTSVLEVSEKFGGAIVGQVPEVTALQPDAPVPLLALDDQRYVYAEAYRNLRSALFFLAAEPERPRVLLITSAVPNEGKSTITANLARTLALSGSRVLLVDADLRKGGLHNLMGLQREPGLAELLRQTVGVEQVIQADSLPNLFFIARGGNLNNPGDLFLGAAFDQLLAGFRRSFDYVLIDSSPVFASDDASTLAPKVDGTLFVVRSRFSRAGPVREAIDLLLQRQAKVLGLVYNRADAAAGSYYYYKHEDYYSSPKPA